MRAILQRVASASVRVGDRLVGEIDNGLLVLLGVANDDTYARADQLLDKILTLRIFKNDAGKLDLSLTDVKGSLLVVSQFTLFADTRKGRRPSFSDAARPDIADDLYRYFAVQSRHRDVLTQTGEFGARMMVALVNDGPMTLTLDTNDR